MASRWPISLLTRKRRAGINWQALEEYKKAHGITRCVHILSRPTFDDPLPEGFSRSRRASLIRLFCLIRMIVLAVDRSSSDLPTSQLPGGHEILKIRSQTCGECRMHLGACNQVSVLGNMLRLSDSASSKPDALPGLADTLPTIRFEFQHIDGRPCGLAETRYQSIHGDRCFLALAAAETYAQLSDA